MIGRAHIEGSIRPTTTTPWCRAVLVYLISNDCALGSAWLLGAFSRQFTAGTIWLGPKASGEVVGILLAAPGVLALRSTGT